MGRFLRSVDTVFARRQTHVMLYPEETDDGDVVHIYAHEEPNPVNPFTAARHYSGMGFRPCPEKAARHIETTGIEVKRNN